MGKIAFVFSGQGAQKPGMGLELYNESKAAKAVFDMAEAIRPGTMAQCFEGTPEELMKTVNTQPCLFLVDLAAAAALKEAGIEPDALAGFSLGEVAAAAFAGVFSYEEGFRLVCKRGEFMQEASEENDIGMAAVLKLDFPVVEKLCEGFDKVFPVNYNSPGQLVVSGDKAQLDEFAAVVKENKGRLMKLPVGGGFHSPFMAGAAEKFAGVLKGAEISEPKIPLYSNYTAKPYGDARELLSCQINNPVKWIDCVENMMAAGVDTFIEVGCGTTLCGLISKISKEARVFNVSDAATLSDVIKAVK